MSSIRQIIERHRQLKHRPNDDTELLNCRAEAICLMNQMTKPKRKMKRTVILQASSEFAEIVKDGTIENISSYWRKVHGQV